MSTLFSQKKKKNKEIIVFRKSSSTILNVTVRVNGFHSATNHLILLYFSGKAMDKHYDDLR